MWTVGVMKMMLQMIDVDVIVAACCVIQMMQIADIAANTVSDVQDLWLTFKIVCYGVRVLLQCGTDCSRKSCF